ncbi:MAG: hypothetical protein PHN88_15550 [Ignavibacteria bacterium]|nr:hypothetical protein [Ignavibacteria bacterium]
MKLEFIENKIVSLCSQPRTFNFLAKNLMGFDPINILNVLQNLEKRKKITSIDGMWTVYDNAQNNEISISENESRLYLKKHMGHFNFLKTPHPLDFEWRNSTESLNYLTNKVQSLNCVTDKTLILGMPTLFATIFLKDIPHKATLIERNKPIIEGLVKMRFDKNRYNIFEADIFQTEPSSLGNYNCAIMDPPWYPAYCYQFLWLASQCVEIGGYVCISLPPINTRPTIGRERINLYTYCYKQGLYLESLQPQKLQYVIPFFEFNAFRSAGVKDLNPIWRKGDFALFRKVKNVYNQRPRLEEIKSPWIEKEIDSIRIRVKKEKTKTREPIKINSLVKGDILPTVSTRDPLRKNANIWTSGNRIFKTNNTHAFLDLLDNYGKKKARTNEEKNAVAFIKTITKIEKNENKNYIDWLYYELEKQIDTSHN